MHFEVHVDGTRLYRREQVDVVANVRDARWAAHRAPDRIKGMRVGRNQP
jgi:hypothetical protein